ncbi:unnamed protein product [Meganyctiphanes norvegica]|uniref:PPC domain-containing protein n=1 Tax=Meganyctiphanes norvegica TaxID=48144 RepID=A0AAV2RMU3_MEGNR
MSNLKVHILRLTPGQEVRSSLEEFVKSSVPNGAFVITCCGSIKSATLRLASYPDGSTNKVIGGHVMGDLTVQTTMEVTLGEATSLMLSREHDDATGYDELVVNKV